MSHVLGQTNWAVSSNVQTGLSGHILVRRKEACLQTPPTLRDWLLLFPRRFNRSLYILKQAQVE